MLMIRKAIVETYMFSLHWIVIALRGQLADSPHADFLKSYS